MSIAAPQTPEEIRERYRIEREKRLRADGNDQYQEFTGDLADFDRDPFADPGFTRDPVVEETDVLVVGGGFGGMLTAIELFKAGFTDYRLVEKAGDFGGTWYWNRYPGCMCDVESYVYLPLLEETGFMPSLRYALAPEIFGYCQLLGRTFDLYDHALFQTEVEEMVWDDDAARWRVTTTRGDRLAARFVVVAGGVLHKAKLPGIPGIGDFAGHTWHTSRWDYSYTGGSPTEPMDALGDTVVGIIGTGATAVQAVPRLAEAAEELFVFQRTPASVGVRNQVATDPEWFRTLSPGWQQERLLNFTQLVTGAQPAVDLIQDSWTSLYWTDTKKMPESEAEAAELERIDLEHMNAFRARIDAIVDDPVTAERLKPWYGQACKRPCFHDEYLPAFNRPNVHLVDTDGRGVDRITERGVVVDGVEYPVDCLVFASGFEVTTTYWHRLGFDPVGRDGLRLSEAWREGPFTLHGVTTRGFPNLLMISTVQGGFGVNFVHYLLETSRHVAWIVQRATADGIVALEPTRRAEEEWFELLMTMVAGVARYNATCTPGYLNGEGAPGDMVAARATPFMGSIIDYGAHLTAWREAGDLAGLEVRR